MNPECRPIRYDFDMFSLSNRWIAISFISISAGGGWGGGGGGVKVD